MKLNKPLKTRKTWYSSEPRLGSKPHLISESRWISKPTYHNESTIFRKPADKNVLNNYKI